MISIGFSDILPIPHTRLGRSAMSFSEPSVRYAQDIAYYVTLLDMGKFF